MQGMKQLLRRLGDLIDRKLERPGVGLRGLGKAAHLAHELKGGGANLVLAGGRLEVE